MITLTSVHELGAIKTLISERLHQSYRVNCRHEKVVDFFEKSSRLKVPLLRVFFASIRLLLVYVSCCFGLVHISLRKKPNNFMISYHKLFHFMKSDYLLDHLIDNCLLWVRSLLIMNDHKLETLYDAWSLYFDLFIGNFVLLQLNFLVYIIILRLLRYYCIKSWRSAGSGFYFRIFQAKCLFCL